MTRRDHLIGIDLGGTKIFTAVANKHGEILHETKVKTEAEKGKKKVLDNIYKSITECLNKADLPLNRIKTVGMVVPGTVNYDKGILIDSPNLPGWFNVDVRGIMENKVNAVVHVENDAQAAAIAEARYGAGRDSRHFVYVTVSTGIGGGIVIDKKLYRGANGAAGEVGHMIIQANQERKKEACSLEDLASGTAVRELFGFEAADLKERIRVNDPTALKALENMVYFLGIGLANLTTILNPEKVIIGGGLSNLGELLLEPVRQKVLHYAFSVSANRVKVVQADLKDRSAILGAIILASESGLK